MHPHEVHPWFASTTEVTLTSHHGSVTPEIRSGTIAAFVRARRQGYRWFQVDAIPIKDDLISEHAPLGRKLRIEHKTRAEVRATLPHAPTLGELFAEPELADAYWNIELKSKKGLPRLLQLLRELPAERLHSILISSPIRPSISKAVHAEFPDVALAAPVVHGGVFGVRFLGRRRAEVGGRPYDCQQCYHLFIRAPDPHGERPLHQAWTIRTRKQLHRMADKHAHSIVDSERLELPPRDAPTAGTADSPRTLPEVAVLALGGGGWRSAFGGVGAVMYFRHMNRWARIREVVGISGGSFAVAALAEDAEDRSDEEPGPTLATLVGSLERAGGRTASILWYAGLAVAALAAFVAGVWVLMWTQRSIWWALLIPPAIGAASFLVRLVVSLRARRVVSKVFGNARMRVRPGVLKPSDRERRYRVGATGLNDGNLYSFTTHPVHDGERWRRDNRLARPLGGRLLSDAVVRTTSLPGLGQMGRNRLYLCEHRNAREHDGCDWVPDRLVDGGISGIFGRGLVEARTPGRGDGHPVLVVVDAGRTLRVDSGRTIADFLRHQVQRFSALALLARWLMVAFEVAYRGELKRVADDEVSDGYRCRLVRLAEPEESAGAVMSQRRHDDFIRLTMLRERVHSFSLVKASRDNTNRGIAVAIAACALEFDDEPEISHILRDIGTALGRGRALAEVWERIPLRGDPVLPAQQIELRPTEMAGG